VYCEEPADAQKPARPKESLAPRRTECWHLRVLEEFGFCPRTVVDVGVADGTSQLYETFPNAFHVLLEPLKEYDPHLQRILKEYEGDYFLTAAGGQDGKAVINVEPNHLWKSSFCERTELTSTGDPVEKRKVPVTTIDTLMKKYRFRPPFGLKIDTEGFEYQVIVGAASFLRKAEFVIAEVSVAKRFEQSYSISDFTELMDRNGFFLWDVLNVEGTRYVDAVFRK
jgi:FkbM family methyltransferase